MVGGERDSADHNRINPMLFENVGHLLGRTQDGCRFLHESRVLVMTTGSSQENASSKERASAMRSSTDIP
jgi:hypothetical protein